MKAESASMDLPLAVKRFLLKKDKNYSYYLPAYFLTVQTALQQIESREYITGLNNLGFDNDHIYKYGVKNNIAEAIAEGMSNGMMQVIAKNFVESMLKGMAEGMAESMAEVKAEAVQENNEKTMLENLMEITAKSMAECVINYATENIEEGKTKEKKRDENIMNIMTLTMN